MITLAIDWNKAYKDIGSNYQSNLQSNTGDIDWDKAYLSINIVPNSYKARARDAQRKKEVNAVPAEKTTPVKEKQVKEKPFEDLVTKFTDTAKKNWEPILNVIPGYKAYASEVVDPGGITTGITKLQSKIHGWDTDELYKQVEEERKRHPVASTLGKVVGYVTPGVGAEKLATKALAPVLGKVGSKVAQKAIIGAATGGGMELAEGAIRGESAEDIAKRTAYGAGFGAAGDVAFYGLGKGIGAIAKKIKAVKALSNAEEKIVKETPELLNLSKQSSNVIEPVINKESALSTNLNNSSHTELKNLAIEQGINPNQTKTQLRTQLKAIEPTLETPKPKEETIAEISPLLKQKDEITATYKPSAKEPTPKEPTPKEPIPTGEVKERGFSQNIRTDMNRPDAERVMFDKDPEMYNVLNNETTLAAAQKRFNQGYEQALKDFEVTKSDLRADNVPLAKLIADEAVKRGDMQTARRVLVDISETLTTAGQYSQAAKILRESNDPATILTFVEKEVKKLNTQGSNRYGKGWKDIQLTDEELNKIGAMTGDITDDQKEQLFNELFTSISTRIPTTGREKFDAWRRMAMLFNPKTHIRNVAGNSIMAGISKISNKVAATMELGLKSEQRTKVLKVGKEFKDTASKYWQENKKSLTEGSRWELFGVNTPFAEKQTFKTKWLETLNDISKKTLEKEDVFFMKKHFTDNLAGYMQARGLKEPTQESIEYATKRAQEATFREANALAEAINKLKGTKAGLIIEAAIPFSKTPANILTTGVKYSPLGLINSAVQLILKEEPAKVIETFSKALTGTGLTMMGFYMAKNGLARGAYEQNKNVEALKQASGELPNSIITPNGSFTLDWAQPASMPFFMGVGMAESMQKNGGDYVQTAMDTLIAGGDTLINQSMLKNIKDLFGGYGSTTEKVMQLPVNYLEQAFPTVGGQLARTLDPFKRQTDYSSNTSKTITGLQAKTPELSKDLPLKRDILGQPQKYGEGVLNVIQQFISPGYIAKKSDDPIVNELNRLYESEGSDFLPRASVLKFTKDKVEYKLNNEEISEFQRVMGEYTKTELTNLIQSPGYKSMSDADKAKAIKTINDNGYEIAKQKIIDSKKK